MTPFLPIRSLTLFPPHLKVGKGVYPPPFSCLCLCASMLLFAMSIFPSFLFPVDVTKDSHNDVITLIGLVNCSGVMNKLC